MANSDADGSVVINVKVITEAALKAAKDIENAYKNVKLSDGLDVSLSQMDKSAQKASKSVKSLGDSSKSAGKDMDNTKKSATESGNSYEKLQSKLKTTAAVYNTLAEAHEKMGNKAQASVAKLNSYKAQIEATKSAMTKQRTEIDELTQKYGANSEQVGNAKAKLQSLDATQQKLVASSQMLYKTYGNLTPQLAKTADQANITGRRVKTMGDGMTSIGNSMSTRFTLPIVTGMGLATKAAMDYQYQLQDVRKEVVAQGYSASEVNSIMSNLSSETLKWSKQFGVGTKEINEGMFELVSNGYNVKQAMGMMPELLKTMTANSDKTGTSIKLTSAMLEQFGMNLGSNSSVIKNGNTLMNQMTEATHKSAMSLGDLQQISGNAGAAMHAMGVSTADFLAISGRLKSAGIDASSVGTGLSAMMTRLGTGTGQAAKDLKEYNIEIFDSNGKMKSMFDILGQMQTAYKGMNDEERQKFMYDTIGQENMKVGMTLMDANLGRYRSLSNEIEHSNGTVNKYNDTMRNTSQFTQQQFTASLHALEVEFGQKLLPTITPIIKDLTSMIDNFSKLDAGTQKQIISTAALIATVGPGLAILGKINSGIGSLLMTGPRVIKFLSDARAGTLAMSDAEKGAILLSDKMSLGTKTAAKGATELAEGTAASATKTGLLRGALGGLVPELGATGAGLGSLILPVAGVTAGIAALGAGIYFGIKAYNDHEKKMAEYRKTLNEFGVNVDSNTQKVMRSFNNLRQSATNDMIQLDNATKDQSEKLSTDVVNKYDKMAKMVTSGFDKMKNDSEKSIKSLNSDLGAIGDNLTKNVLNHVDKVTGDSTAKVEKAKATIHRIYKEADGDLSQMTAVQRSQFEDAQNYIAEQTSAFAISLRDQQALMNAYKTQHGNITTQMYKEDVKSQKKAYSETYDEAKKERDKELASLKKSHKEHLITDEQYHQESSVATYKYNSEMAKSNISYAKSQDELYKHYKVSGTEYLVTKQSINDAATRIDATGQKAYQSVLNGQYVSREQWIKETKAQNEKYIKNQQSTHGTVNKNLSEFHKNAVKFYKQMGLTRNEAIVQANADQGKLEEQTDKAASNMAADAEKIKQSYLKGLQSNKYGSAADVANKWGLDLSDTITKYDLGKYGKRSAKQLWDDFNSGSKKGQEEAELYFRNTFKDWKDKGKADISDLDANNIQVLRQGLESGVINLKDLKDKFGTSILNLFPNDLSQVPEQEMKSLKSAYKNKIVSLQDMKSYFGDSVYKLFPDDLSKLGEKEVSTLSDGLKHGKISVDQLKAKFGPQLDSIYKKDLSDVGQDDIDTLQAALDLGLTNTDELKQKFGATLDRVYKQTPELSKISKSNIDTLQQAMSLGIVNAQDIENKYKGQLDKIYTQDLSKLGKNQLKTLANGLQLGLPEAQNAMKKIQGEINKGATVDLKGKGKVNIDSLVKGFQDGQISVTTFMSTLQKLVKKSAETNLRSQGSNAVNTYADGINGNVVTATTAAVNTKNQTEAGFKPTDQPYNHGSGVTQGFSNGILSLIKNPIGSALTVHDQSVAQFAPDDLATLYGGNKSKAFANGILTNGGLPMTASASVDNGVNENFNDAIDSGNNITKELGGKGSFKKHTSNAKKSLPSASPWKTGTNGKLGTDTPSIVGDGYEPELIDYGNGQLELSPAVPTFRMLNQGAQVFSGRDTKMIQSVMDSFGIPMFANGTGGDVGKWISNAVSSSWDWIKSAVGDIDAWISDPVKSWSTLVDKQFNMSPFTGNATDIGNGAKGTEKKLNGWLNKLIESFEMTSSGAMPAKAYGTMIRAAAAYMHEKVTDFNVDMIERIIANESGGNPRAINLTDNNAKAGTPSKGILQYIDPTFNHYAMPGHQNIYSPFDQLIALFNDATWRTDMGMGYNGKYGEWRGAASGPSGPRKMNLGSHITSPETLEVAEKHDEFIINPWEATAPKLTTELLQRIQDVNPTAFQKIVLPGAGVSPENISGFKAQPVTQAQIYNQQQSAVTTSNNNSADSVALSNALGKFDKLIEAMSGDATIEVNVDGSTLATATFPKMKLLLNDYIRAEMTRKGR